LYVRAVTEWGEQERERPAYESTNGRTVQGIQMEQERTAKQSGSARITRLLRRPHAFPPDLEDDAQRPAAPRHPANSPYYCPQRVIAYIHLHSTSFSRMMQFDTDVCQPASLGSVADSRRSLASATSAAPLRHQKISHLPIPPIRAPLSLTGYPPMRKPTSLQTALVIIH
jgi:hypothetical protein